MKVRWKTNEQGMERLRVANRLVATGKTLNYVRFLDDFPAFPINNLWDDTQSGSGMDKIYVVQTNKKNKRYSTVLNAIVISDACQIPGRIAR